MKRVLVVVAHPDDESLGMGGTIAKWTAADIDVSVLALADGETSRASPRTAERQQQFIQACETLGSHPIGLDDAWPDQRLDTIPILDVTQCIEQYLDGIDTLCTHIDTELNLDHVVTARAARVAARRLPRLYAFHTPSSPLMGAFRPSLFIDVSKTLETKLQAVTCYCHEIDADQMRRGVSALRDAAAAWRDETGLAQVEAFEVIREIR